MYPLARPRDARRMLAHPKGLVAALQENINRIAQKDNALNNTMSFVQFVPGAVIASETPNGFRAEEQYRRHPRFPLRAPQGKELA